MYQYLVPELDDPIPATGDVSKPLTAYAVMGLKSGVARLLVILSCPYRRFATYNSVCDSPDATYTFTWHKMETCEEQCIIQERIYMGSACVKTYVMLKGQF